MRIQLESPQSSGHTNFRPAIDDDVLMDDEIVAASPEQEQEQVDDGDVQSEEGAVVSDERLAVLGITTSEQLIQRLKSKDDIDEQGKSKIYVALSAFRDTRVPIAKKTFLLADWVLEAIVKNAKELPNYKLIDTEMDPKVLAELLIHEDYWKLLVWCVESKNLEPADLVMLANKHPLPALLQSYVYFWQEDSARELMQDELVGGNGESVLAFLNTLKAARTSKQVYQLDLLNQCLASWLSASPLPDLYVELREDPHTDLPLDLQLSQYLTLLGLVLALWLSEATKVNNGKKVQDFFLAELLPLHAQALWWLQNGSSKWPTLLLQYRAIINRTSFQSLVASDHSGGTPAAVLQAVAEHKSKSVHIFLSTYLSQLCVHHTDKQPSKSGSAWVREGEWRQELFQSFVSPAIESTLSSIDGQASDDRLLLVTSLHLLFQSATRWNLHFTDEAQSWRSLLEKAVDTVLVWQGGSHALFALPGVSPYDAKDAFQSACAKTLDLIHQLDESVLDKERRTRVIVAALDRRLHDSDTPCEIDRLLTALCGTSIKSRRVVEYVQSCQDALDAAILKAKTPRATTTVDLLLKSEIFHERYWQKSLGVAVRDFISADEAIQLLTSSNLMMEKRCADVQAAASSRKRKLGAGLGDDTGSADQLFALAIVRVYFSCALLSHITIHKPAIEAAQACLSSIQTDVICKHLAWTLSSNADDKCDALATALLKLHESIQQLALACGKEEQEGESTWSKLASQWDLDLGACRPALSILVTQTSSHRKELLLQAYMSVLHLIARGMERQSNTPFDSLLSDSSTLFLLSDAGLSKLFQSASQLIPVNALDIPYLQGCDDIHLDQPAVWNLIGSPYLPIFEQKASDELLRSIAHQFVWLAKPEEPRFMWDCQSWELLCRNSSNLELPRWRKVMCTEIRQELEKPTAADTTTHSHHAWVMDVLDLFPRDWLPVDLQEMLSDCTSMIAGQDGTGSDESTFGEGGPLGLTAFRFCTLLHHGFPTRSRDDSPQTVFAEQCRRSTPAEYEAELNNYLKALNQRDDEAVGRDDDDESNLEAGPCGQGFSPHSILQTLSILLCNSPEGTLLISQRCLTGVIATLQCKLAKEYVCRMDQPSLSCIQFVGTVLSTKPILFRSADISAVFTLATQCLVAESSSTDAPTPSLSTKKKSFSIISTTLIECIRLRRDFVSHYLPQLTMLLVRMLQEFQGRSKAERERELEEAKVFSRLLSSITAKSTSASIGGLPESKMKSLAKSFSTHAPYVIVAFTRNMTLPTFTRGETREELVRGIYELCDIVGPWQKNVMMDMLADEAERIVMRSLWRGWEAQRYKGA